MLLSGTASAENEKYWEYDIPIIRGAQNVSIIKDKEFCTYSISYDLKVKNTKEVLRFYINYFKKIGWKNPLEKFNDMGTMPIKWNGEVSNFKDGLPVVAYSSFWEAQDIAALGGFGVTLTNYSVGVFDANIHVSMEPKIDMSPIHKYHERLMEDPKNIFILYEAVQSNPYLIESFTSNPNPKYQDNIIVKEYYEAAEKILLQYKEFRSKYILN